MHEAVLSRTDTVAVRAFVIVQTADTDVPSGVRNQKVTLRNDDPTDVVWRMKVAVSDQTGKKIFLVTD